jgi:MFS family permease
MADRWGARRLTLIGLVVSACVLPIVGRTWSFHSGVVLYTVQAAAIALAITPSLAYMADAASQAGIGSFGVAFGLYNFAWGVGLLGGPSLGGFLFDRMGFGRVALLWATFMLMTTLLVRGVQSQSSPLKEAV